VEASLLKRLRLRVPLNVEEAAEAIGVSPATVYAWEALAPTRRASQEGLRALLDLYKASAEDRDAVARLFALGE
jgi:transcriptional regulator with XRE-family HTH domain